MRRLDFFVQTILILLGLIIALDLIIENEFSGLILFVQFFLGLWQIVSAFCYIGFRTALWKERMWHLAISCVYLFLFFVIFREVIDIDKVIGLTLLIVPSWILGFYYYSITYRITFPSTKKKSSFLPHLNF